MTRSFGTAGQKSNREPWMNKYPFFDLRAQPNHGKWFQVRPVGIPGSHRLHWVQYKNEQGQDRSFPLECSCWNPETETFDTSKPCAGCEAEAYMGENYVYGQTEWFGNFILRDLQRTVPAEALPGGTLHIGSHPTELQSQWRELTHVSWSPIVLLRLTPSMVYQMRQLQPLNQRLDPATKQPVVFDLADPDNGTDLFVQYNPNAAAASMYVIQKSDPSSLTEEERMYKLWNVDTLVETDDENSRRSLARRGYLPAPGAAQAESAQMTYDAPPLAAQPPIYNTPDPFAPTAPAQAPGVPGLGAVPPFMPPQR